MTPFAQLLEANARNCENTELVFTPGLPIGTVAPSEVVSPLLPSLPQLDPEPGVDTDGVIEVGLKLPSGERRSRRFNSNDKIGHSAAFVAVECRTDMNNHRLAMTFPRRFLDNLEQTLGEAGLANKDIVIVERLL